MTDFLEDDAAEKAALRLVRAWRAVCRTIRLRPSRRGDRLLLSVLEYIHDLVEEHYEVPSWAPTLHGTVVSQSSFQIEADEQSRRMENLAIKLTASRHRFSQPVRESTLQKTFVRSAMVAAAELASMRRKASR